MQSYDDVDLKKKLIEFKLTEPRIAIELVRKAVEKKREHQALIFRLNKVGDKLLSKMLENKEGRKYLHIVTTTKEDEERFSQTPIAGIDGSFQVVGGRGRRYYIMLTAVIVELPQGLKTSKDEIRIHYPENGIDLLSFDDPTLGEQTHNVAEDIMMYYETAAIYEAIKACKEHNRCFQVFIDGPLADPPRPTSYEGAILLKNNFNIDNYIKFRSSILAEAYSLKEYGLHIAGYVKSSKSDRLLKLNLIKHFNIEEHILNEFAGDSELAYIILSKLVLNSTLEKQKAFSYIGPFKASGGIYEEYSKHGIDIYFIYGINKHYNRVFRLELGIPQEERVDIQTVNDYMDKLYRIAIATTLPGNVHPLPIVLAHEKCKIRKGAAEFIYETILTRIYKDLLTQQQNNLQQFISFNILMEDLKH